MGSPQASLGLPVAPIAPSRVNVPPLDVGREHVENVKIYCGGPSVGGNPDAVWLHPPENQPPLGHGSGNGGPSPNRPANAGTLASVLRRSGIARKTSVELTIAPAARRAIALVSGAVGVGDAVAVDVRVDVGVSVLVAVRDGDAVGASVVVAVGVIVRVAVTVAEGVAVRVAVSVCIGVREIEAVALGVAVTLGECVGATLGEGGVEVGLDVSVIEGVALCEGVTVAVRVAVAGSDAVAEAVGACDGVALAPGVLPGVSALVGVSVAGVAVAGVAAALGSAVTVKVGAVVDVVVASGVGAGEVQPARAALTAWRISSTVTAPSRLVSKPRHVSTEREPTAMATPVTISSTVTSSSWLQSPGQGAGVLVADAPQGVAREIARTRRSEQQRVMRRQSAAAVSDLRMKLCGGRARSFNPQSAAYADFHAGRVWVYVAPLKRVAVRSAVRVKANGG